MCHGSQESHAKILAPPSHFMSRNAQPIHQTGSSEPAHQKKKTNQISHELIRETNSRSAIWIHG
uniref:Uncharacterized protein n=1 Tax=Arundo donax TaxID=35708 RepID=A0A0A9FK62_ARUDO